MPLRRKPKQVDWQQELRQRSAGSDPESQSASAALKRFVTWRNVGRVLAGVCAVAWTVGVFLLYASKHRHDSVIVLVGGFCIIAFAPHTVGYGLRYLWRRWNPPLTVFEQDGDVRGRIRYELRQAGLELRQMLELPTERAVYERWLETETEQLELIAPNTARRWAQPDTSQNPTDWMVTKAELGARRRRLLDLYAAVSSPEQVRELERLLQAPSARAITSS